GTSSARRCSSSRPSSCWRASPGRGTDGRTGSGTTTVTGTMTGSRRGDGVPVARSDTAETVMTRTIRFSLLPGQRPAAWPALVSLLGLVAFGLHVFVFSATPRPGGLPRTTPGYKAPGDPRPSAAALWLFPFALLPAPGQGRPGSACER